MSRMLSQCNEREQSQITSFSPRLPNRFKAACWHSYGDVLNGVTILARFLPPPVVEKKSKACMRNGNARCFAARGTKGGADILVSHPKFCRCLHGCPAAPLWTCGSA
jgi:hypothetical protein